MMEEGDEALGSNARFTGFVAAKAGLEPFLVQQTRSKVHRRL